MRLTELEPQFLRYAPEEGRNIYCFVDTLAEADGISFLCPKCFHENCGPIGTHGVICWFEGRVPDELQPNPGRWNPTGTGYGDLSFVPGKKSHSVLLLGGCAWHGFITVGEVT